MNVLRSIEAYYPLFPLGGEPVAVKCNLSLVEAGERKYLRTPFAMLPACGDDDPERQIGHGYFATESDCRTYLANEYPHWEAAAPIMDRLQTERRYSEVCGPARTADRVNESVYDIHKLARGHRSFTLKRVRAAAKLA